LPYPCCRQLPSPKPVNKLRANKRQLSRARPQRVQRHRAPALSPASNTFIAPRNEPPGGRPRNSIEWTPTTTASSIPPSGGPGAANTRAVPGCNRLRRNGNNLPAAPAESR